MAPKKRGRRPPADGRPGGGPRKSKRRLPIRLRRATAAAESPVARSAGPPARRKGAAARGGPVAIAAAASTIPISSPSAVGPKGPDDIGNEIARLLARRGRRGFFPTEIIAALSGEGADAERITAALAHLVGRGNAIERKDGRYVAPGVLGLLAGRVQGRTDGNAVFVPDDADAEQLLVQRRALRPAMHGDRVLVEPVAFARGGRRCGQVSRVLERGTTRLVGVLRRGTHTATLVPHNPRIGYLVTIPLAAVGGARDGDAVVADITRHPTAYSDIEAAVVATLGAADDPRVDSETVIYEHGLPLAFPPAVEAEAARVPNVVPAAALAGRLDLRALPIVTIDGENARDFDDAVLVEALPDGAARLTVAVADVAAYVRPGSALDAEAAARGTSVYFPDRVIPMLPEALSNGICSLVPGEDRLVKVARLRYDADGALLESEFANGVIRSAARLTYTEVAGILAERDATRRQQRAALVEPLERMERLCRLLMARRRQRGSIDFDLPEAEIVLDLRGRPENIARAERTIAHQLIEEFMLAANEAVARRITERGLPMLYRVHEPPGADAVAELATFLEGFGLRLAVDRGRPQPGSYQRVLASVAGRPEARLVNRVLLRSLTQARYAAENLGHFGLASKCYTHFTSPIRRYPDLVVHRMLDATLGHPLDGGALARVAASLPEVALHSSRRERIAMEAERDVVALKKAQFMGERVGEIAPGIVSDVTSFGFFVELVPYFVEGLVHVSTLGDDFYEHDERAHCLRGRRRHRTFRIGDPVTVQVASVSVERRQIDFVLAAA